MMTSFYDLLKYAKTGIASSDMTAYDKMRALSMAGGKVKTLTGLPPLIFNSNGKPLISWSMLGNGQQDGTPAPDAPIMPEFVGEIDNIFEGNIEQGGYASGNPFTTQNRIRSDTMILVQPNVRYYMNFTGLANQFSIIQYTTDGAFSRDYGSYLNANDSFVFSSAWKLKFVFRNSGNTNISPSDISNITLSRGYKLPITNAGQTTPVYLGQVQTTRKIKKLVLTGEEVWAQQSAASGKRFNLYVTGAKQSDTGTVASICTHFPLTVSGGTYANDYTCTINNAEYLYIRMDATTTLNSFKQWLADQYAAGTPVVIWYVLETSETAIVNEPLCKIGDYADELHSDDAWVSIPTAKGANTLTVDTELQPSSMTITYR